MPKGGRGKGGTGKHDVGQDRETVRRSHKSSVIGGQVYAQQMSHNPQSPQASNAENSDAWNNLRELHYSLNMAEGGSAATNATAAQDPTHRWHTTGKCSPRSPGAGHPQSSEGRPGAVIQSISRNSRKNVNLKPVEHGNNRMSQGDTTNMETGDTRAADDCTREKPSKVIGRLQTVDEHQLHANTNGFFVDLIGSTTPIETGLPPPTVRSSSSLMDPESEDEVIVFSGRRGKKVETSGSTDVQKLPSSKSIDDDVFLMAPKTSVSAVQDSPLRSETSMFGKASQDSRLLVKGKERKTRRRERLAHKNIEVDEILADYIANIQASDGPDHSIGLSQLVQPDSRFDAWEHESLVDNAENHELQDSDDDWNSVDLQDFDGFSTSSESMLTTPRIFAKRLRNSAVQYLVTHEGGPVDEARWLPPESLKAADATDMIAFFEQKELDEYGRQSEDEDESGQSSVFESLLAMDLAEDKKALEDEKDLEDRQRARMSDEQIARLLSKQADLGIIGDELVLFNDEGLGTGSSDDRRPGRSTISRAVASSYSLKAKARTKKRSQNSFPSATLFADVLEQDPYNGFDIMDRERLSLRKKPKKGGRAEINFDLSDPDLQQSLEATWLNDRTKKKQRKLEREQLRAQGLLGKKGNLDLGAKFSDGLSIADVKNEIKTFLRASSQSQALPPMGHGERKAVHEIANKAGLKSKSIGTGVARFPVLYKTSRTKALTPEMEFRIDAVSIPKKFLPRIERARKNVAPPIRARKEGFNASASYRDGEVVGTGAPELGMDNRGRAMLEKMGWSTGTALGAVDNKGIAQPIAQVVKTSKAGLG